ncbi:hypothetical protein PVK06_039733 [Gossypium arboreum]|uniref:Uncharacterized protein n=1 Tax=Gossypium arboreum TaxID=29729 RepID=A0ABR0N3Q5_GOSAR|nr:hypothetical protein PVK06_039733 [Gossypium arboreum]
MAGSKPSLRQWLGRMELRQWAQYFYEGYRYGHMTTNLVEAVNFVLSYILQANNLNAKNGVETSKIVGGRTRARRKYHGCYEKERSKG